MYIFIVVVSVDYSILFVLFFMSLFGVPQMQTQSIYDNLRLMRRTMTPVQSVSNNLGRFGSSVGSPRGSDSGCFVAFLLYLCFELARLCTGVFHRAVARETGFRGWSDGLDRISSFLAVRRYLARRRPCNRKVPGRGSRGPFEYFD